jgi:hypothetical protein
MDDARTSTGYQRTSFATSRADRERSLDALHALELLAGSAAPGREQEWLTGVREALTSLQDALGIQEDNTAPEDSLLSEVAREAPRLLRRVDELRRRYRAIFDDLTDISRELDATATADTIDVTDIRQSLERLAGELRYQRARETDLVYEAYAVDLGEGD